MGYARHKSKKKMTHFFRTLLTYGLGLGIAGGLVLWGTVLYLGTTLPDIDSINTYIPAETTKIMSQEGVILAELHREENRISIPIDKISPILQKTVVAMEDSSFYDHNGLDYFGILRAIYKDVLAGSFVEGGSTLTQQLAKNLFFTRQKKITRKISEAIMAIRIENHYTKTEILEMYLNQVYWGHNAYGIESASRYYFGKTAQELSLSESAVLVGMLSGPELYSPYRNFKASKNRQRLVLNRMVETGLITREQADDAYLQELKLRERTKLRYKAPYFTSYIVKQLVAMYGEEAIYTSGMKVYTTLRYDYQKVAEAVVEKYVAEAHGPLELGSTASPNFSQAAILAIDPTNGYIVTMHGGADFLGNMFNRTTQAMRQPGSVFKPFVYLAALAKGYTPNSHIEDSPVTFSTFQGPYSPKNYTNDYSGSITLRRALEKSVNTVAIKLNHSIGPETVVATARKLGITSKIRPVLSLPLGANEVTMLELVSAYGVLANEGYRVEPFGIIRIEDRDGVELYRHHPAQAQVYDANLISTLVDMMKGVVINGTGQNARLPRPMAGKTGTTSDYRDAWFIGFIPQLVAGTWVGNDDNSPMNKITGGGIPALMWRDFMKEAVSDIPPRDFRPPRGLRPVIVDKTRKESEASEAPKKSTDKVIEFFGE